MATSAICFFVVVNEESRRPVDAIFARRHGEERELSEGRILSVGLAVAEPSPPCGPRERAPLASASVAPLRHDERWERLDALHGITVAEPERAGAVVYPATAHRRGALRDALHPRTAMRRVCEPKSAPWWR